MTEAEVWGFLTSMPPHTGKVATVRADGRPHVAPVWYVVDDDRSIVFNTGERTVKGRNLRRTGYAAMSVDDERPPFSFVTLEGPVELIADLDQLRRWATLIGGRYMGEDRAEGYGDRNASANPNTDCDAECFFPANARRFETNSTSSVE